MDTIWMFLETGTTDVHRKEIKLRGKFPGRYRYKIHQKAQKDFQNLMFQL